MSSAVSSPHSECDVKEVLGEFGLEREHVNVDRFSSHRIPHLSTSSTTRTVDDDEILRSNPQGELGDGERALDMDANISRNWNSTATGRPRDSSTLGTEPDSDLRPSRTGNSSWTQAVKGCCSEMNFEGKPLDPTDPDELARKSVSLEGLWHAEAEAEPPRSFSYGRRSVEHPRRSFDRWRNVGQGRRWRSRSAGSGFLSMCYHETGELFTGLDITNLNISPPSKETAEITLKSSTPLPIYIKFTNLVYRVCTRSPSSSSWMDVTSLGQKLRRPSLEKIILHGISGAVCPGEILGILGPSGSGKTTLVQILAGRISNFEGTITHNDIPFSKSMNRRMGLVTQDDFFYPHLTVTETITSAALLRLPRDFSRQEKTRRALDVLTQLGLDKCQDRFVGSVQVKGTSEGERKRLSIGCEILTDPTLLLLDEPTSGLDSTTALSIVRILRNLSHSGKTIISTMHQPSSVIFHMLDRILLLSDGHPLFFGSGNKALGYFEYIGFHPTFASNPADFLVDLASGVTHDLEELQRECSPFVLSKRKAPEIGDERNQVKKVVKDAYLAHMLQDTKYKTSNLKPNSAQRLQISRETVGRRQWSTSWLQQFLILAYRALRERRHENFSAPRVFETLAITTFASLIWWNSSNSIENQAGLLFFSTMIWAYFPLSGAIHKFPLEKDMVRKERASGMYRLSAYFFAQFAVDLPMELILPTFFTILVYWMGGLKPSAVAFFTTWAILLSNVLVAQGMGLAISAVCSNLKKASHVASASMLGILMAGGFFSTDRLPALDWLKYISFVYHAFKLQLNSQFSEEDVYSCGTGVCQVVDVQIISTVGLGGTLSSALAMLAFMVGFRLLAYIGLRRMKL